jgi:hypothetical protein
VILGTQTVRACDVCAGLGLVQGDVHCPEVRVSGTVCVLNPGDPGYAEARARIDEEERLREERDSLPRLRGHGP